MRYACIARYEGQFPIALMCRVVEVSRAGYYAWRTRRPSARVQHDRQLRVSIRAIHAASSGRYGRPRIHESLRAQEVRVGAKRVGRLMRLDGLRGRRARAYRVTTQASGAVPAPNRLQRQFDVAQLNQVWASDVTAWQTTSGWLYVAVVLDLASRRVIGWASGSSPGQALTLAALRRALARRRPQPGLIHHSDRGMHYTGTSYQCLLAANGIRPSMSRRGDCWDNAVVESFFATLKAELVSERRWPSPAEATAALAQYLAWYNGERLHSTLGYISPRSYEVKLAAA